MDRVLPLDQWGARPQPLPAPTPCFLTLGLKRPQTVMEMCHRSQIPLHMEARVSRLCRRQAPAAQEAGQRSDPNALALLPTWLSGAGMLGSPSAVQGLGKPGGCCLQHATGRRACRLPQPHSTTAHPAPPACQAGHQEWGYAKGNHPTHSGSSPPRGASYPINCPILTGISL